MATTLTARINVEPGYVLSMARVKAMQESRRPEHDLRLLLAHISLLDKLDHSVCEVVVPTNTNRRAGSSSQRASVHPRRASHQSVDDQEKDSYDSLRAPVVTASTTISVQEISDDEEEYDWIG